MFGTTAVIASRVVLAYLFGETLSERVELNSSTHGLISLKEASFWTSIGRSPYTGSIYRGPPLLLLLCERTCTDLALQATLLGICDWVGSRLLWALSGRLLKLHHSRDSHELIKTAASLYLCNPFLILSSSAGSTASLVNLTLISSLYGAVYGNAALAGFGIAAAAYLSPHNLILLVPLTLLLQHVNNDALLADDAVSNVSTDDITQHTATQASAKQQLCRAAQPVILYCALFLACLVILSDIQLRHYPEHYETSCAQLVFPRPVGTPNLSRPVGARAPAHWTMHVYGYMFWAPDTTPNIGMWWYFFAEVFPSWRAPFKVVYIAAWLLPPMLLAKKLYGDPLLLFTCYCIIISLLKPHPTVADAAMFMALLPFFPHLLSCLPSGVFSATSLLILASLGPAMWFLWMELEAANANFFYAITLLWAAWQVMLLLQLITAADQHNSERIQQQQSMQLSAKLGSETASTPRNSAG